MQRPSFLDQEPPPGYIPGIGRGATGFSTRGDQAKKAQIPKRLRPEENGFQVTKHANELTGEPLSKEAVEAEQIFAAIETRRSTRRKTTQSASENVNNQIPRQFADLKRSLATVSEEEWLNLPDAGDLTRKNKRERLQDQLNRKEYVAPDTLINRGVNFTKLTEERERLLGRQLDNSLLERVSSDALAAGSDVISYLDELESSTANNLVNADEAEEVKRMRMVLSSYRKADPMRPEGWIASARLEEKACKFQKAKSIMEEACAVCPKNDEVWLERVRLNSSDVMLCRALVADGIRFNPKSLPLWTEAIELENEPFNKRRVVMKALHELPTSEKLWKQMAMLESDESERQRIIRRAVELLPTSIDLWKELIKQQDYSDAKKSLNTAKKYLSTDYRLWILAVQIEERGDEEIAGERLEKILVNGMTQLQKSHSDPGLVEWLSHAQALNADGMFPKAAVAIVHAALSMEDLSQPSVMKSIDDMRNSFVKITAYRFLINKNPGNHSFWMSLRTTCLQLGKQDLLYEVYEATLFHQAEGYKTLKQNPTLSLIYAKEVWKYGKDASKALDILERSTNVVPSHLDFWIAKLKVLCFSARFEEAKETFNCAFQSLSTAEVPYLERLYLKYVSFLRFQNQYQEAIDFLEQECLEKFPECYKFYIQKGQTYHDMGQLSKMRETYSLATKKLPQCPILWILLAKADETDFKNSPKARSELDIALLENPHDEALYLARIEMECREGFHDQAKLLVLQALQKFPHSAVIWAANVRLIPSRKASTKKTVFQDALRSTKNSYQVLNEIGSSFFRDGQYSTAIKWFERATNSNPKFGDAWVWLARCCRKLGNDVTSIYKQVEEHEPVYGPLWISVTKDMRYQYSRPSEVLNLLLKDEL
ncbi:hypothetical protein HG536_0C03350 [Torulaspora globosa]|uniref:PRP1 splicing factor N-terminal domain-containing protein n=1 Tax=Torulaspora globosa TaxID=48254 RepID=A0A7G3ZF80_9SACH|nr:uncharacterized protein HG536_0C03350 [Torulaspora globosa]QLL32166.1 hypothetical protein HG536_0C03350 [Torulaspora globosa]